MPHISPSSWRSLLEKECDVRRDMNEVALRLKNDQDVSMLGERPPGPTSSNRSDSGSRSVSLTRTSTSTSLGLGLGTDCATSDSQLLPIVCVDDDNSQTQDSQSGMPRMSTRVTWTSCQQSLETAHKKFLVKRVLDLQDKCSVYQKELKRVRRMYRKLQAVSVRGPSQEIAAHDYDSSCLEISKGSNNIRLTRRGFIALGVRKSLAWSSSVAFPLLALVDTSRQTVTRAENAVWSMLVCRSGAWHQCMYTALEQISNWIRKQSESAADQTDNTTMDAIVSVSTADSLVLTCADLGLPKPSTWQGQWVLGNIDTTAEGCSQILSLGGTAFSGDATNSGIWRRNKLQSLLLTSAVMSDPKEIRRTAGWHAAFSHHTTVYLGQSLPIGPTTSLSMNAAHRLT